MIKKAGKVLSLGKKAIEAKKQFKEAKSKGEISFTKELSPSVQSPGQAWLLIRGLLLPVTTAVLSALVGLIDQFVAADLSGIITDAVINSVSVIVIGGFFIWSAFDILRGYTKGLFGKLLGGHWLDSN